MKRPGLLRTLLLLALVDASLRMLGFARVMRIAKRLGGTRNGVSDPTLLTATLQQVMNATTWYPGRAQCLEQSVAGYILVRRRGYDVRVRLGVRPYPFTAHAWLEHAGRPLTESEEAVSGFAVLPELAV